MQLNPLQTKVVAVILFVSCINLLIGCHRYYRPVVLNTPSLDAKGTTLKRLSEEDRIFILRRGYYSYTLNNIILDQQHLTLTGNLNYVPVEHLVYLRAKKTKYTYSKSRNQDVVLKEVHLYTGDTSLVDTSMVGTPVPYTFPLSDVNKIEVIEFDKKSTTSSFVWGTVGAVLAVGLVVLIIVAASEPDPPPPPETTGSCPYISTYDGDRFVLQGEVYSAAVFPSLQKEDYLPVHITNVEGDYRVRISNELKEIQHTDLAELLVVEHDNNVQVLMDDEGNVFTISQPQLPLSAVLNNEADVRKQVFHKDNSSCLFIDMNSTGSSQDLYIKFKKDANNTRGKLVLNAKSSAWVNHLYNEFASALGDNYNKWVKQQEKRPAGELEKWTEEQDIPLTVSVKTNNGWKEIKKIKTIGPILHRELVIPMELPVGELVELKLSTGFMFWELDYVGMDFSSNDNLKVSTIKPYEAINEKGVNVLREIIEADKKFIIQPDIGDFTILKYRAPETDAKRMQTVFLHTSGYYTPIRDYEGRPKLAFLKSFKQPGALSAFSKREFSELFDNLATVKN